MWRHICSCNLRSVSPRVGLDSRCPLQDIHMRADEYMSSDEMARRAQELVARMAPILLGHSPEVQSAALADLVALWLARHQIIDGDKFVIGPEIDDTREKMLDEFVGFVRSLIPVNDAIIREQNKKIDEVD